jgi:LysR family transcriptional activator of nhaA
VEPFNFRQLYYFTAIVQHGSVTGAARTLGIGQPALSEQLRALEVSVGRTLLERTGNKWELTETGQLVFRYAREIADLGQKLRSTLDDHKEGTAKRVVVGVTEAMPRTVAARLLEPAMHHDVTLEVLIGTAEALRSRIADRGVDLILADETIVSSAELPLSSVSLGSCGVTFFATGPAAAVYARNFPKSLQDAPMLVHRRGTPMRAKVEAWLARSSVSSRVHAEVEDVALLKLLGQRGAGVYFTPTWVADEQEAAGATPIGAIEEPLCEYFAATVERRIQHPLVDAIVESGQVRLGGVPAARSPRVT